MGVAGFSVQHRTGVCYIMSISGRLRCIPPAPERVGVWPRVFSIEGAGSRKRSAGKVVTCRYRDSSISRDVRVVVVCRGQ